MESCIWEIYSLPSWVQTKMTFTESIMSLLDRCNLEQLEEVQRHIDKEIEFIEDRDTERNKEFCDDFIDD